MKELKPINNSQEFEEMNYSSDLTKIFFVLFTTLILFLSYWQIKRYYDVREDQKIQQEKRRQIEIELKEMEEKIITKSRKEDFR